MLPAATDRILALPDEALVLDVGGWAAPFNRADWVIDAMPFATRGAMGFSYGGERERFAADTWVVRDVCAREPWPFDDGQFDLAMCVTTLEDLRDPIWVLQEMSRVAKAGYLEVPTMLGELVWELPGEGAYLGNRHHHWLCRITAAGVDPARTLARVPEDGAGSGAAAAGHLPPPSGRGGLGERGGVLDLRDGERPPDVERPAMTFVHKQHSIHADPALRVSPSRRAELAVDEYLQGLFWSGELPAHEQLLIGETLHAELRELVDARFPPTAVERRLRRGEERLRRRAGDGARPLRRAVGAALRRARSGRPAPAARLADRHVRPGLGRPRDER
ncbi:class I SAM-dependent methyltransferase [Patulibacter brassicae]|uniref:Class I SAM-dependent methyltransferase n=1 Tax=Patulibacter brassicae TaxID=1705717 RepID=A0ABU4VJH3_9ACTN|nr:class I SAM-dependent methyltransferase [Patulibacter brassicae]MDX8151989.1 class I SAM-dependent methyltransferase [Patulibacter brassicae]